MTEITIFSGFLGAGKTTLIKKLLFLLSYIKLRNLLSGIHIPNILRHRMDLAVIISTLLDTLLIIARSFYLSNHSYIFITIHTYPLEKEWSLITLLCQKMSHRSQAFSSLLQWLLLISYKILFYASLPFASSTKDAKPAASFTAMSARIFRSS